MALLGWVLKAGRHSGQPTQVVGADRESILLLSIASEIPTDGSGADAFGRTLPPSTSPGRPSFGAVIARKAKYMNATRTVSQITAPKGRAQHRTRPHRNTRQHLPDLSLVMGVG